MVIGRYSNEAIRNTKVVPLRLPHRAAVVAAFSWWYRISARSRKGNRFRLRNAWKCLKQALVDSINRRRRLPEQRRKQSIISWAFVRWRAKSVLQQRQRAFNAGTALLSNTYSLTELLELDIFHLLCLQLDRILCDGCMHYYRRHYPRAKNSVSLPDALMHSQT